MGTDSRMPPTLRKWETTRQLGKRRYVVRNGVVGWGIPVGIILTLFDTWRRGFSAHAIVIAVIIWPIAGYFVGLATWAIRERRYQQLQGRGKTEA
jgi:hypothetical protein